MMDLTYYAVTCTKDNTLTTVHIFDNPEDANKAVNILNNLFIDRYHAATKRQAVLSDAMLIKHKKALLCSKEALQELIRRASRPINTTFVF